MSAVKERVTEIIQDLPEDTSFEEIIKELAFELAHQKSALSRIID